MSKIRVGAPSGFITSEADLRRGVAALRRRCPVMRSVYAATGDPPLRIMAPGFEGLSRIIVGQQVSTASATAIWGRLSSAIVPMSAAGLLSASEETLRAVGLSRPKIRTLYAIARAATHEGLDLDGFVDVSDEAVHDALTAVSGIGPWTTDIFLMFCLGRRDAFAAGDLALQVAAQHALALDGRPSALELLALAERWRPWRSVAARLLWAYYRVIKQTRSGAPV
jgi:DNA-3-methyladenine glycosylase II